MADYYKNITEAFDEWADTYEKEADKKLKLRGYSYEELGKYIADKLIPMCGNIANVLELGTGTGILGINVIKNSKYKLNLTGIDISGKMLEYAREKGIYSNLKRINSEFISNNEKYDYVYSAFMFHSILDKGRLLKTLYKIVNKNSKVIIIDLVPDFKLLGEKYNLKAHSKKYEHGAQSRYIDNRAMIALFNSSDFDIIEITRLGNGKEFNHISYVLGK